jgi:hypothetical protein
LISESVPGKRTGQRFKTIHFSAGQFRINQRSTGKVWQKNKSSHPSRLMYVFNKDRKGKGYYSFITNNNKIIDLYKIMMERYKKEYDINN